MAATTPSAPTDASGPTPLTGRSIAPDLARGVMLLLIVVANAPWYLWSAEKGMVFSHPTEGSSADLVAQTIALIAIDGRTYPMFAFLFGYGIVQLYRRQHAAGVPHDEARRLLRRRHWWMVAFGAVHALLLWFGDVIGAYGLAGLLLVWLFLDRREVTQRVWAIVLTALLAIGAAFAAVGAIMVGTIPGALAESEAAGAFSFPLPSGEENPLLAAPFRLAIWIVLAPGQGIFTLVTPIAILVAFIAAGRGILERPQEHVRLLRRTAIGGIGIGWAFGLLLALQNLGVLGVPRALDWGFLALHSTAGLFCGIGYVALFGLIAARLQARGGGGRIAWALQAVGKRSMTCYLAQSVVFAPLMSAWGLGLGAQLSSWSIALVGVATWLATVVLAVLMERAGRRGPAEVLLRRLAYPPRRAGA